MVSRDLVPVVASKRGTIVSAIVNPLGRGTDPSYGFMERFANVTPQNKKGLRCCTGALLFAELKSELSNQYRVAVGPPNR
jgi:hypothetical protein